MPKVKKTFILSVTPAEYIASCSPEELKELRKRLGKALKPSANKRKRMKVNT